MPNQDAVLTIAAEDFPAFSDAIYAFNARTKGANRAAKKAKYDTVARFPERADVKAKTVTIRIAIKDRAKVLWQDLAEVIDRFVLKPKATKMTESAIAASQSFSKPVSSPIPAPSRQWGIWVPCADEAAARAAAGFLQAIAKVGQPQVECRG